MVQYIQIRFVFPPDNLRGSASDDDDISVTFFDDAGTSLGQDMVTNQKCNTCVVNTDEDSPSDIHMRH